MIAQDNCGKAWGEVVDSVVEQVTKHELNEGVREKIDRLVEEVAEFKEDEVFGEVVDSMVEVATEVYVGSTWW
jgi:predicted house-cleaning noncanonical NTP pyrophosphatase (MazG superfamily)